jgi:hypothetical protein
VRGWGASLPQCCILATDVSLQQDADVKVWLKARAPRAQPHRARTARADEAIHLVRLFQKFGLLQPTTPRGIIRAGLHSLSDLETHSEPQSGHYSASTHRGAGIGCSLSEPLESAGVQGFDLLERAAALGLILPTAHRPDDDRNAVEYSEDAVELRNEVEEQAQPSSAAAKRRAGGPGEMPPSTSSFSATARGGAAPSDRLLSLDFGVGGSLAPSCVR